MTKKEDLERYRLVSVNGKSYHKGFEPKQERASYEPPAVVRDVPLSAAPWTPERACKVLELAIRPGRRTEDVAALAAEYVAAGAEPSAARESARIYLAHNDPDRGCGEAMAAALNEVATAKPRQPEPLARVVDWPAPNVVRVVRELGRRFEVKRLCFAFGARDPQARMRRRLDGSPVLLLCDSVAPFATYDEVHLCGPMPKEADARAGDYVWDADEVFPAPAASAPAPHGCGRCSPGSACPCAELRAHAALWPCEPPPWPEPETADPYKARAIAAIDAASRGPCQTLPPSRTLDEAVRRARERWALAIGGMQALHGHAGAIEEAMRAADAPRPRLLTCDGCGRTEIAALVEGGPFAELVPMRQGVGGVTVCDRCDAADPQGGAP
jgi:hypothetical protein